MNARSACLALLALCVLSTLFPAPVLAQRKRVIPSGEKEEKSQTYYELLDVPRDASVAVIRKAYRKLALLNHPDKAAPGEVEEKHALFVRLANGDASDKRSRADPLVVE